MVSRGISSDEERCQAAVLTGKRVYVSRTICISYSHGMEKGLEKFHLLER